MKHSVKRFLAKEVIWFTVSIVIFLVFYVVQSQIASRYHPLTGRVVTNNLYGFEFPEIDLDKKKYVMDAADYTFLTYVILAYPVRYLLYLLQWALHILKRNQTPIA